MGLTVNHPFSFLADQDREPYAALTTLITDRTLGKKCVLYTDSFRKAVHQQGRDSVWCADEAAALAMSYSAPWCRGSAERRPSQ